ncbi:MAG: PAS domain S-box protein [Methylococcales bacterium]
MHIRFDNFEFDSDLGVFHESGIKINLQPKELAVLEVLFRRHGKLVTKEQLINSAWNGANTSDESIARCISIIKSRLRDASPGADLLIKTEYGRGYRFTGSVSFLSQRTQQGNAKQKKIRDIFSKDILHCDPDTTVLEAAHLLYANQKSSIIVNQHHQAIGIWTEADAMTLNLSDPLVFDKKISEVMHSPVITIQEWKPLSDAVLIMRNKNIRHLLVVDKSAKASGVISQTDLVKSHGVESFLTIKDVKSVDYIRPLVITENLQISEIVQRIRLQHTEVAIIRLPGRDMFTFTERDLMGLIANKQLSIYIIDFVNKPLVTVSEEMTLLAARQLMEIEQIRHLVVLDSKGGLLKILSLGDILKVIEYSYVKLLEEILEEKKHLISVKEEHIQMLTNAVQQTAGMILISNKFGEIEYVNKAFENISGYTLDEVKGLNPRILKSGENSHEVYHELWQTLLTGQTWKGELCNRAKSGACYWVLASITPIYNNTGELKHFVAVEEDITERIEMETKLKEFEQRFKDTADAYPVMFWESGTDGKVFYLNHFWVEFTGCELKELYGNGWARQIHPDDLKVYLDYFQQAMIERKAFVVDHRLKNAAGEYRWVMNSGQPRINDKGTFLGFIGYCIDITERKIRELVAQNSAHQEGLTGLTMAV